MCYKDVLDTLQDKINKIEDEDPNYRQNENWIKHRQNQDKLYDIMRKQKEVEDERSL